MKIKAIHILLLGFGITLMTILYYLSKRNEFILNKFVITTIKSFHFNNTPVLGFSVIALSEYLLWESQNNNNLIEAKIKLIHNWNNLLTYSYTYIQLMPAKRMTYLTQLRKSFKGNNKHTALNFSM